MIHQINISFTKENKLKIILDDKLVDSNLKLCFSLVYSIKSITGAEITKQIGRYYELSIEKNTILLHLQIPRIGNFNLSSGPEGIFIIDKCSESMGIIFTLYFLDSFFIRFQPQIIDSLFAIKSFWLFFIKSKVGFKPSIPGIAVIKILEFLIL